jgi:hypothetical protein
MMRRPMSASRPCGRCAVGLRPSLDPATRGSTRPSVSEETDNKEKTVVRTGLDLTTATDKQGSTLVRWAAVEAAQKIPARAGWLVRSRAGIAERRGRNIATVAVARKLLTLVYYGLRDGHIRALTQAHQEAA